MKFHKKLAVLSLSAATSLGSMISALPVVVQAEETTGVGTLQGLASAVQGSASNIVDLTFGNGYKGRITFLEEGIFRYNVDPSGTFAEYATPSNTSHVARIQAQPDDSERYSHPAATVTENDAAFVIQSGTTKITIAKTDGKMSVEANGKTVMAEKAPLSIASSGTSQTLEAEEGEDFYGGGTQNGRIVHTGKKIHIANESNWVDGGVASPNPFYWSTKGYGVLRNTFAREGYYDFGESEAGTVTTTHSENEFDAYYFVSGKDTKTEKTQELLQDYFQVTGNPVLLPEYGFYLGHLNCYNRDGWSDTSGSKAWTIKGSNKKTDAGATLYENGMASGYILKNTESAETLNGKAPTVNKDLFNAKDTDRKYSAQAVIDRYQDNDMPFGWFLPNDGYGCGYGQNGYYKEGGTADEREASLNANVANLAEFTEYANSHGVSTGLWTQSNLTPIASEKQHLVRDFRKEVLTGGITTLKTDVAWVGAGYSFGLNGTKQAYDIVTAEANKRPNIVTLDGWAGSQRYGTIWSGDQYGGNWEYIRFHIPTFIGQSLSGNPNAGSDMDGIFGGAPVIATRDYQWKTFISTMLDMDGWGSYVKGPFAHGDPYTGISRMYLKLKAQLMPYIYTSAASAANIDTENGDTGLPMIRAMMLVDDSDYAASNKTMYQYMFGDSLLVAPVYQDTAADADGNDIRNDIYLPGDSSQIWIDYFTGKQYRGGQVIENFDAPLWKLPLFVKNGAIIPMYEENNNPEAVSDTNPDGLDKTKRIVEFYPEGTSEYTLFEDDGITATNEIVNDADYGAIDDVNYGGKVLTTFHSAVDAAAKTATLKADKSRGTYDGYDSNRSTTFVANVSVKPSGVDINGAAGTEVASLEAFEALGDNESGWFYDAAPEMNKYTPAEESDFASVHITNSPKVYVKFAKTDVAKNEQTAVIRGFSNEQDLSKDVLNAALAAPTVTVDEEAMTPTTATLNWTAVDGADSYEIFADGELTYYTDATTFTNSMLEYHSDHTYKVRARNADGYSEWSEVVTLTTLDDPWRNVPVPTDIDWSGDIYGSHKADLAFNHVYESGDGGFHSNNGGTGETLTVDYGLIYQFEKLDYHPRDDAGNGTVTAMDISYSKDGVHWTNLPRTSWERSADVKTVEINDSFRYIKMTPVTAVGGFFSASEIAVYKKDGTNGYALGSNLNRPTVSQADYDNLIQYRGVENKADSAPTFLGQIKGHEADMNDNDVYDVYDYSFTLANLDGGTTKTGEPEGKLFFMMDKTDVKAGDIVTVSLYGQDIKNANAIGGLFRYDTTKFEVIVPAGQSGVTASPFLGDMENLSISKTFDDNTGTMNVAFANRGDKALYSGSRNVATFKLRAKVDGKIDDSADSLVSKTQQTFVVGPQFGVIDATYTHDIEIPEVPGVTDVVLGLNDLDITMTNSYYTTDDGTNVSKLVQQGKYDSLFNGNSDTGDRGFELLWSNNANYDEEKVVVPLTMHFAPKTPAPVSDFHVYTGATISNGKVLKISAEVTFADGSTKTFSGGEYDEMATHYAFNMGDDAAKIVNNIDVTFLETGGAQPMHNLTLSEIVINAKSGAPIDSITVDDDNVTELGLGKTTQVKATVNPAAAADKYFTVESSDPSVVSVDAIQDGEDIAWFIRGNKGGTATITVTSHGDPTKSATYTVTVSDKLDTADLAALIDRADAILEAGIVNDASVKALTDAKVAAADALANAGSQDDIDRAQMDLQKVIDTLNYRAPSMKNLINRTADSGVTAVGGSSECGTDLEGDGLGSYEATLDKDNETYWHSNWANSVGMPQYVDYNLGKEYDLTDVSFLPRQNGRNGDMFKVEILAGDDADSLTSQGVFTFAKNADGKRFEDTASWKTMTFPAVKASYVRVKVLSSGGDTADSYASMSEIRFFAKDSQVAGLDESLLREAISKSDALTGTYQDNAEKTAFDKALASAKETLENAMTQEEIDEAASALNQALLAIRLVPSKDLLK